MELIYALEPERFDIHEVSPNGRFAIKAEVDSFAALNESGPLFGRVRLFDLETTEEIDVLWQARLFNTEIHWSCNSRFAALTGVNIGGFFGMISILDAVSLEQIDLDDADRSIPTMVLTKIDDAEVKKNISELLDWWGFVYNFLEWESDDEVKISFIAKERYESRLDGLESISNLYSIEGWFVYDVVNESVTALEWVVCYLTPPIVHSLKPLKPLLGVYFFQFIFNPLNHNRTVFQFFRGGNTYNRSDRLGITVPNGFDK